MQPGYPAYVRQKPTRINTTHRRFGKGRNPNRKTLEPSLRMSHHHLELLQLGAASLDEWRADNPASRLDLRGAELSGRSFAGWNLSRALLDHADLAGADLSGSDLSEASLKWANLEGAKMRNAVLYRATLVGSNLRNADLTNAAMYRVSLKDANIEGADFTAATMQKVIMPAERKP